MLGVPAVWELSRVSLDLLFGLYRKRTEKLGEWGLLSGQPSVLDIGCGIGQYARITEGDYLGIDVDCRYVRYARKRRGNDRHTFECVDAVELAVEERRFDLALVVDVLHHLSDDDSVAVLAAAGRLAQGSLACFEPVSEQESRLGRWFTDHDRGGHMRSHEQLLALVERAGLSVGADEPMRLGPIATRALRIAPSAPRS
jgi:SAM-dependent methyltransferase